jgi:polyisoprenoid-binding protein YceI
MKKTLFFALAILANFALQAQTYVVDKAHANMGFTLTHLAISEVEGSFKSFDAKITASKEDFSDAVFEVNADLKKVTTDNEMRDGHLQKPDMFDTEKFPTLSFKSTGITKVADKKFKLTGDLTMKGVTKPVTLDLVVKGTSTNRQGKKLVGVKVTGTVKRSDYGVGNMPSAMVSEEIELHASGEFVQQN